VYVTGFKKCCTSNAVDGTDNDILWDSSAKDWVARSDCEEDEGTVPKDRQNL